MRIWKQAALNATIVHFKLFLKYLILKEVLTNIYSIVSGQNFSLIPFSF